MRLNKITMRGVTCFAGTVSVDYAALGPGLIAVVGKNGAGKSSVMEGAAVALWKSFPSRPGFYENFQGQDAFIEAEFSTSAIASLVVRLTVDAVKRTCEAYLIRDGVPLTDGKKAGFATAVTEYFGSIELFLASVFACQTKKGNFFSLVKSDRKDIFVELLGLGALQVLSESARERKLEAEALLASTRKSRGELAAQAESLAGAPEARLAAQVRLEAAASAVENCTTREVEARAALEAAKASAARADEVSRAAAATATALEAANKAYTDATALEGKAIKRLEERMRFLKNRKVEALEPAARARHETAIARIETEKESLRTKLEALPNLEEAKERKLVAEEMRNKARAIAAAITAADLALKDAQALVVQTGKDYDRLIADRNDLIERLVRQTERLKMVPCASSPQGWIRIESDGVPDDSGPHHDLAGTCPLLSDARKSHELLDDVEKKPRPDSSAVDAAKEARSRAVDARQALPDEAPNPDAFERDIFLAADDIAKVELAGEYRSRLFGLDDEKGTADATLAAEIGAAQKQVADARAEALSIQDDYEAEILAADTAAADAETNRAAAVSANFAAQAALAESQAADAGAAERAALAASRSRLEAAAAQKTAQEALTRAALDEENLGRLLQGIEGVAATEADRERQVGDWTLLEKSLGRDGVQALEIDASGPEVAGLTNELLEACYGARFSLTLETLAEKRDGGMKEVFDVRVFDSGQERTVEALSGGEKVIVGEALGLALSIFNAKKNDIKWETLWRDETAGALDPENAQAYVRMMRKAREIGGFHQVIFVSHQPEVWEAADAILHVADGTVYAQGEEAVA